MIFRYSSLFINIYSFNFKPEYRRKVIDIDKERRFDFFGLNKICSKINANNN